MARRSPPTDRVVAVLELLAAHPGRALTFSQIMRDTGLTRATCHAVLMSLTEAGYVLRDTKRAYLLGPAVAALGRSAEASFPHVPAIAHLVRELVANTGHPCALTSVMEQSVIVLDHAGELAGPDHLRRGNHVPFVAPYGTIHAAWSSPSVKHRWLHESDLPTRQLRRLLDQVQRRGFSASPFDDARRHLRELLALLKKDLLSQEIRQLVEQASGPVARDYLDDELDAAQTLPISSISAPVFDDLGRVTFAIHLEILESNVARDDIVGYARAVMRTAAAAADIVRAHNY
jgi:DNA-binding IclR family transcriptional regulator